MNRRNFVLASGVSILSLATGASPTDACCLRRRRRRWTCRGSATPRAYGGDEFKTSDDGVGLADSVPPGPRYHSGPVYIINGQTVKFVYRTGALLSVAASRQAVIDRGNQTFPSHLWNDQKYWVTLDTGSNSYLLYGWYNRNNGDTGWIGILNTEDTWWFRSSKRTSWHALPEPNTWDAEQWGFGAYTVALYAKNPRNVNGFTANDIIYKIGWSY